MARDLRLVAAGKVVLLTSEVRKGVPLGEEDEGSGPSAVTDDPLLFDADISNVMVAASVQRLLQHWSPSRDSQHFPAPAASDDTLPQVRLGSVQWSAVWCSTQHRAAVHCTYWQGKGTHSVRESSCDSLPLRQPPLHVSFHKQGGRGRHPSVMDTSRL